MTVAQQTPDIQGLPPGAIVRPLTDNPTQSTESVQGLPPGATVRPLPPPPSLEGAQPDEVSGAEHFLETTVPKGIAGAAGDVWGAIKGAATQVSPGGGPQGLYDKIKESIPIFHAYENARSSGKGIVESLSAANDEAGKQEDARNVLKQRVDEFKKNPGIESVRAVGDAAAIIASLYMGGPKAEIGEGAEAGEVAPTESVEPAPEMAAKEARVQKSVSKVGLEEGEAAQPKQVTVTPAKTVTTEGTEPTQPPQGTMHEPLLQQSARKHVNEVLEESGLKPLDDTVDLRDIGDKASKQFYASSKAGFDAVKEATGVDVNVLRDQLRDLYSKKAEIFGDPEREGIIIEKINSLEGEADQAFKDAKDAGVDVDKPLAAWKQTKALSDYGETVRASVDPLQKSGTFDPGKYAPRLEKMYRTNPDYPGKWNPETQTLEETPGRLEQGFGKERAETMRDESYAASETQQALKNFKPEPGTPGTTTKIPATKTITEATPATESKALYEMVRKNTGRRFGVLDERTNWVKTYSDFDKLTPGERLARFKDPAAVERVILKQARNQRLRAVSAGIGVAFAAHEFGVDGFLLRKIAGTE